MSPTYWAQRSDARRHAPCLFLDRDGVLVREVGYLHRPQDLEVLPGAGATVRAARENGFAVGVVTNQSGVGRGRYGWPEFVEVQAELERRLGMSFDFVAACGAHAEAVTRELRITDHPWRKPRPGMLLAAAEALRLDLEASVLVGDHLTDVQAALAAGVGRVVHVLTGHGAEMREAVAGLERGDRVLLAADLDEATRLLGWA